jgi:hypothetical protein
MMVNIGCKATKINMVTVGNSCTYNIALFYCQYHTVPGAWFTCLDFYY